jgi:hypothetical protein
MAAIVNMVFAVLRNSELSGSVDFSGHISSHEISLGEFS